MYPWRRAFIWPGNSGLLHIWIEAISLSKPIWLMPWAVKISEWMFLADFYELRSPRMRTPWITAAERFCLGLPWARSRSFKGYSFWSICVCVISYDLTIEEINSDSGFKSSKVFSKMWIANLKKIRFSNWSTVNSLISRMSRAISKL